MKIEAIDLRHGYIISHKGRLCKVITTEHVKPGKGGAFIQAELKDIRNQSKLNERFRSSEKIERVLTESFTCSFVFCDHDSVVFMDKRTHEQISVPLSILGHQVHFLDCNIDVSITTIDDEPISVNLPASVPVVVLDAETFVKGQTASGSGKPAVITGNLRVMVPVHISPGDVILIEPTEIKYLERQR